MTPEARTSGWVKKETDAAIEAGRQILPVRCDDEELPEHLERYESPKLGPRSERWRLTDTLAKRLEDRSAPVPRVVNLSGHPVRFCAGASRLLVLDTHPRVDVTTRDPQDMLAKAQQLAAAAGPAIAATNAGIIPPGLAPLAVATLCALQGWKNRNHLPMLYWFCNQPGQPFEADGDVGLSLQAVREKLRAETA